MTAADDAYDRLHGLDGYTQATCPHDSEEVGTGAGEGATGQDTGTAWVTRSADCPEAPAQAHPLGPDGFTPLVSNADYRAAFYRVLERCEELKTSVAEHQWNALEMARKADLAERRAEESEYHVEQLRDARDRAERQAEDAEAAIEATRDLLDGWEQDGPDDPAVHLLIQRVREMLALQQRFEDGRTARPLPIHRTEAGYPNCSTCDGGGCLDCTDPA